MAAVQNQGSALEYVPDELKTLELCLASAQQLQLPQDVIVSAIGG